MRKLFPILIVGGVLLSLGTSVFAYRIEDLPGTLVEGDIVFGPGKIELVLEPGSSTTREIYITNRLGREMTFQVEVEDMTGSPDPEKTVIFLGEKRGPYTLKDWVHPEIKEFTLQHGQRMRLPVEIKIPEDAEPGGRYGVVFVATKPEPPEVKPGEQEAAGGIAIRTRTGALLFVRIPGEVKEEGYLKEFGLDPSKRFFEKGPITFKFIFENQGNVHLNPHGRVEIKNMVGKPVGEIEVAPFFTLPNSSRMHKVTWERKKLFGKYIATAYINRGYDNITDVKAIEFWVIPWKLLAIGLVGLFLLIWFVWWVATHFEIRRKS